uniref:Uncharacterized protein n=1 Tax=Mycena chlorophos TaxID=658473 RepID=A0ABQ0KYJ5_MYCCL|nr:predicted protein [Mycena chlorophos]
MRPRPQRVQSDTTHVSDSEPEREAARQQERADRRRARRQSGRDTKRPHPRSRPLSSPSRPLSSRTNIVETHCESSAQAGLRVRSYLRAAERELENWEAHVFHSSSTTSHSRSPTRQLVDRSVGPDSPISGGIDGPLVPKLLLDRLEEHLSWHSSMLDELLERVDGQAERAKHGGETCE